MKKPIKLVEKDGRKIVEVPDELRHKIGTFSLQYLQENGFFNDEPSDKDGYTPWYTYPAIDFLKDILKPEHKVIEYGSGYSTLFYSKRVKELFTVEHDLDWAKKIVSIDPSLEIKVCVSNCRPIEESIPKIKEFIQNFKQIRSNHPDHDLKHGLNNNDFAGYASMIYSHPKGYFDVVVVDGMARSLCGYLAVEMIKDDGIIILDNSDRWHYNNLQRYFVDQGFGRIDFWGPGHGLYEKWCTSFFSRKFQIINNQVERVVIDGPIIR